MADFSQMYFSRCPVFCIFSTFALGLNRRRCAAAFDTTTVSSWEQHPRTQVTPQVRRWHQHANTAAGGKGRVRTGDRRHPVSMSLQTRTRHPNLWQLSETFLHDWMSRYFPAGCSGCSLGPSELVAQASGPLGPVSLPWRVFRHVNTDLG